MEAGLAQGLPGLKGGPASSSACLRVPGPGSLRMGGTGVCHPSSLVSAAGRSPAQPLPSTSQRLLSSSLLHFPSVSPFHRASPHPLSLLNSPLFLSPALLSSFPHTLPFSFLRPSPLSPLPPQSMNPFSSPSLENSPIPGPKAHPLFSIRWEGQGGSPDLLRPAAVGVGPGLHRRAALNDKRRY